MTIQTPALRESAFAKINLALHVRKRMADGYHQIETLFAFCADGDVLEAEPAPDMSLVNDGPFASGLDTGSDNLVMQAAKQLHDASTPATGAVIRLTKNLPTASGIGSGSADAAAALRLLAKLWGIPQDDPILFAIAKNIGADVPACLHAHCCRGEGRGEQLIEIDSGVLNGMAILLVNPGVAVPTGSIFAAWDGQDRGALSHGDPLVLDQSWRNDLMNPALHIVPIIANVLAILHECDGAKFVRMSGSGATCFALFESPEICGKSAEILQKNYPEWWSLCSTLRA